jgi:hypothetical protein
MKIALERDEEDYCQRGTFACCVDHDDDDECYPW